MDTALALNSKEPTRQARLKAWFALHGVEKQAVAKALGMTPQAFGQALNSETASPQFLAKIKTLNCIPEEYLPEPVRPKAELVRENRALRKELRDLRDQLGDAQTAS